MARISSYGKQDALAISGEVSMPLVILKKINLKGVKYLGFIPGLTNKDVVCDSAQQCKDELKNIASQIVKEMAKNGTEFPFFPSKEDILKDYPNTAEIAFIRIKSQKRKTF